MIIILTNKIFSSPAGKVVIYFITGKAVNHIVTYELKVYKSFLQVFFWNLWIYESGAQPVYAVMSAVRQV